MRKPLLLFFLLLFAGTCLAQSKIAANPTTFDFKSGGKLRLELGAGDVDVVGSPEDKIVVTYRTSKPDQAEDVTIKADLRDTWGTLKVSGPHNNFHYTVQVPAKTNLHLRISAGDLEVKDIIGSKDIESHAGDLTVYVGDPSQYGEVDASVNMGDLNMPAFGVSKGGIGRKYRAQGKGEYRLHVPLGAGDLTVR